MSQTIRDLKISTDCASCMDKCCSQPYDWVYLSETEVSTLVQKTGRPESDFTVQQSNPATGAAFKVLNLPCTFFDERSGKCTVHEVRPLICELFPFYPDPMTGQAMFYPAQCGPLLQIHPLDSEVGWNLARYETDIQNWIRAIWAEALSRKRGD